MESNSVVRYCTGVRPKIEYRIWYIEYRMLLHESNVEYIEDVNIDIIFNTNKEFLIVI